jgi:hypothetical protein
LSHATRTYKTKISFIFKKKKLEIISPYLQPFWEEIGPATVKIDFIISVSTWDVKLYLHKKLDQALRRHKILPVHYPVPNIYVLLNSVKNVNKM